MKERIKNIDVELENWINLKSNSEKMTSELSSRKNRLLLELNEFALYKINDELKNINNDCLLISYEELYYTKTGLNKIQKYLNFISKIGFNKIDKLRDGAINKSGLI